MINEVKIGDIVSFRHKKKQVTGKVIHRHADKEKAFLAGHVNVQILGDKASYPVTIHVSKIKPALKEEYHMQNIHESLTDLVDNIDSGNHVGAEELFNTLLQEKISALLDDAKIEVAQSMFTTSECAECDEEVMDEAKKMKDGKEAEKDEEEEEDEEDLDEALKGKQHKIDANKNGKIDAQDFKMLRAKKGMKEEAEQIDEAPAHSYRPGSKHPKYSQTGDNALRTARKVLPGVNRLDAARKSKMYGKLASSAKNSLTKNAQNDRALTKNPDHKLQPDDKKREATLARTATSASRRFAKIAKGKHPFKEEAEQIDEYQKGLFRPPTGFTKKGMEKGGGVKTTLHYAKKSGSEPVGATMKLGRTTVPLGKTPPKPTRRVKEEVEQVDELKKSTLQSYADKVGGSRGGNDGGQLGGLAKKAHAEVKSGNTAAAQKTAQKFVKREKGLKTAVDKLHQKRFQKEEVEQVDEVITKKTPTGEVIKDFVHSKNPKFKGKSKKERIRMALGAKYGMMKKGK